MKYTFCLFVKIWGKHFNRFLVRTITKFIYIAFIFFSFQSFAQTSEISLANEYFRSGQFEKAKDVFEKVLKDDINISIVHKSYLSTLYALNEYNSAEKYLKKLVRQYPDNPYYRIDYGLNFQKQNKSDEAQKYFNKLINDIAKDEIKVRITAQYFVENRMLELAIKTFLESRKQLSVDNLYAYELANIYMYTQNLDEVVSELINFSESNPSSLELIKNSLQGLINKEEDYLKLEKVFIKNIQSHPQELIFNELLLWLYVQQKQFYKAYIQARAIDKRIKSEGENLLELGMIAYHNKSYDDALVIFQYIIDNYSKTINYIIAKNYLISSKEEVIKNTYPIDYAKIESLINDYSSLIQEVGHNVNTAESMKNMALLYAFYYGKLDTATNIIQKAMAIPQLPAEAVDRYKIVLGDIYLLKAEPWESTLLYSQVEKSEKEKPLGHEAKLKNAKLSYYKGDFKLAQSHLDILKLATSREIANDAMDLSLLIQDNIGMDSTEDALREYAKVDLLLFQNKKEEALERLTELEKIYSTHTIIDEIVFLKGKIFLEIGKPDKAIENFQKIYSNYPNEIYGDDALFFMAQVYDQNLKDNAKALELYTTHLKTFPGSIFTAEVRKRIRKLRGDTIN